MPAYLRSAYLRVYQPLDAFGPAERVVLERAIFADPPKDLRLWARDAQIDSPHAVPPDERRSLYTCCVRNATYVCASMPDVRALEHLASHRYGDARPATLFTLDAVEDARRELRRIGKELPGLRPTALQSLWHVPRRWFVCFEDAERRMEHIEDHPRIRYETSLQDALTRVDRALSTLDHGIKHPAIIAGMVVDLAKWLRSFSPESLLELDYASVSGLFSEDELADDHSVADMWARIDALGAGDGRRASELQRRLEDRWETRRSLELTN